MEVLEMSEVTSRLKAPTAPCPECGYRQFILWRSAFDPNEQAITCNGCGAVNSTTRPLAPHVRLQRQEGKWKWLM
jgi:ribosomal protein S27E